MTQQYTPNIGGTPDCTARRDCVHVALAPVVAAHALPPGHHVGLNEKGEAEAFSCDRRTDKTVGIVDPFLEKWVEPGEKFWLFLYPGTVTSMRHLWTAPGFETKPPVRTTDGSATPSVPEGD